uniref:Bromo domain-containing protein n=1 Tax=Mesocestoides corti TaxID=53468 RepID=A0A5K3G4G6_MESCO
MLNLVVWLPSPPHMSILHIFPVEMDQSDSQGESDSSDSLNDTDGSDRHRRRTSPHKEKSADSSSITATFVNDESGNQSRALPAPQSPVTETQSNAADEVHGGGENTSGDPEPVEPDRSNSEAPTSRSQGNASPVNTEPNNSSCQTDGTLDVEIVDDTDSVSTPVADSSVPQEPPTKAVVSRRRLTRKTPAKRFNPSNRPLASSKRRSTKSTDASRGAGTRRRSTRQCVQRAESSVGTESVENNKSSEPSESGKQKQPEAITGGEPGRPRIDFERLRRIRALINNPASLEFTFDELDKLAEVVDKSSQNPTQTDHQIL